MKKINSNWMYFACGFVSCICVLIVIFIIYAFGLQKKAEKAGSMQSFILNKKADGVVEGIIINIEPTILSYLSDDEKELSKAVFMELSKKSILLTEQDLHDLRDAHSLLVVNLQTHPQSQHSNDARQYVARIRNICERH